MGPSKLNGRRLPDFNGLGNRIDVENLDHSLDGGKDSGKKHTDVRSIWNSGGFLSTGLRWVEAHPFSSGMSLCEFIWHRRLRNI
jgi:hypothetical protein